MLYTEYRKGDRGLGRFFGSWLDLKIVYDFSRPECVRVFNSKEVVEEEVQLGEIPCLFSVVGWGDKIREVEWVQIIKDQGRHISVFGFNSAC